MGLVLREEWSVTIGSSEGEAEEEIVAALVMWGVRQTCLMKDFGNLAWEWVQ